MGVDQHSINIVTNMLYISDIQKNENQRRMISVFGREEWIQPSMHNSQNVCFIYQCITGKILCD